MLALLVAVPSIAIAGGGAVEAAATVPFSDTPIDTWGATDRVRAITSIGNTAYLGGHFTSVVSPNGSQTKTRGRLAAIDLNTGEPTAWSPYANNKVWAMVAAPDGQSVFVGGSFTTIDGQSRKRVAEIDVATGQVTPFKVNIASGVRAMAISDDGSTLYIGGVFRQVNGQNQRYLAAVRTSDGSLISDWRPFVKQVDGPCPPRCEPEVTSLAFNDDGSVLYFGGHFGAVDGLNRNNAAAITTADATVTQWNPNVFQADPNNPNQRNLVNGIAVSESPARVFVCGDFWKVGGQPSPNLAAVDPVTGAKQDWVATTDGGTPDCATADGVLYLGGHFQRVGGRVAKLDGVDRNHIAAVDVQTADVLPWDPNANSVLGLHIVHLAMSNDGDLMAGGDFTRIGGQRQQRFAVFDRTGSPPPPPPPPPPGDHVFTSSGSASSNSWQVFPFPADAGDELDVTLNWSDGAARLNLFLRDPSGNLVAADTSSASSPKQVSATAGVSGTWTVAVKIKSSSTSFNVAVDIDGGGPPPSGGDVSFSSSGSATNQSWQVFEFPANAGSDIAVSLTWDDPAARLNVFLRDPSGNTVTYDNSTAGSPKQLGTTAAASGTWSIGVKIKSGSASYDIDVDLTP